MTSEPGKQIITTYLLCNISRSKGNHTIKFGTLIEYKIINFFFEKLCAKQVGETSPRPFPVKKVCFYRMSKSITKKIIEIKVLPICFYFIESFFKKQKDTWN